MTDEASLLEETLIELANTSATGLLEVMDDRKRWQFFFDRGALVATRSNLKSEQDEAIARELGEAPEERHFLAQAVRRLSGALRAETASASFKAGVGPSRRNSAELARALTLAIHETRDLEDLRERSAPVLHSFVLVLAPERAALTGGPLDQTLATLDGGRLGEDVIAFAPSEPRLTLAALWVGWQLGILGLEDEPSTAVDISSLRDMLGTPDALAEIDPDADLVADHEPTLGAAPPPTPAPAPAPKPAAPVQSVAVVHEASLPRRTLSATPAPATPAPATPAPTTPAPAAPATPAPDSPSARLAATASAIRAAKNHFELLGVGWDQPADLLRAAFMRLARDLHPDRFAGASRADQDLATELFDRVRAAWEELSDDARRQAYIDRVIHGRKSEDELAMEQVQLYLSAETDFKRGMASFNAGQTVAALGHFKSALEKAPDELEFLAHYGYTLFYVNQKRDPAKAAEGFRMIEEAIQKNATQERKRDSLYLLLARAWRERGDAREAKRAIGNALKINNQNADALRLLRRIQDEEAAPAETNVMDKVSGFFGGLFKKKEGGRS